LGFRVQGVSLNGFQWRTFAAIRKELGLFCGFSPLKDEVFAFVGLSRNLKDLTNNGGGSCPVEERRQREIFVDNLLVRIHAIIEII
jgi:hypothetical protein